MPTKKTVRFTRKKATPPPAPSPVTLTHATELMQTYRHARVMKHAQGIKTVQTAEGLALLLSLDKGALTCTRETPTDPLGWVQTDLTSALRADFAGKQIVAKRFDVAQDPVTRCIDLALVLSDGEADHLYVSFANAAPEATTAFIPSWQSAALRDPSIQSSAGASKFEEAELVNLALLVERLSKPVQAIDTWMAAQLSAAEKAVLKSYRPGAADATLASCLTKFFNARVAGASLFEAKRFQGVTLRDSTKALLEKANAGAGDTAYLNRLLLEDVYPQGVARNRYLPGPLLVSNVTLPVLPVSRKCVVVDLLREPSELTSTIARFVVVASAASPRSRSRSRARAKSEVVWKYCPLPSKIADAPASYRDTLMNGVRITVPTFSTLVAPRKETGDNLMTLGKSAELNVVSVSPLESDLRAPYREGDFLRLADFKACAMATSLGRRATQYQAHLFLVFEANRSQPDNPDKLPALYFLHGGAPATSSRLKRVCAHPILARTQRLCVANTDSVTVVFGVNWRQELFCMECPEGEEGTEDSWSAPTVIMTGVNHIACHQRPFARGRSVLFVTANVGGDTRVLRLIRDTETRLWQTLPILLPTNDPDEIYPSVSWITDSMVDGEGGIAYSTKILATGEDRRPVPNLQLGLSSNIPCSVRVNGRYCLLSATPIQVPTDASGALNIDQEVGTIGAVCYRIQTPPDRPLAGPALPFAGSLRRNTLVVNPMTGTLQKLKAVKTGADLPSVFTERVASKGVVSASGTISLDAETLNKQREVTAKAIAQFTDVAHLMPTDGSLRPEPRNTKAVRSRGRGRHFGVSYTSRGAVFHDRLPAANKSFWKKLRRFAGDCFEFLKKAADKIASFFVSVINEVVHFTFEIAGEVFQFVVRCAHEVLHGIDVILRKVGISLKAVMKWLGRAFGWDDILKSQKVLAKLVVTYVDHGVAELGNLEGKIDRSIDEAVKGVAQWSNLGGQSKRAAKVLSAAAPSARGFLDSLPSEFSNLLPSTSWALNTFCEHLPHIGIEVARLEDSAKAAIQGAVQALADQLEQDLNAIKGAACAMADLIKALPTLSPPEIITRVLGLITVDSLKMTKSGLLLAVKLFRVVAPLIKQVLNAPIKIPVFSRLYREMVGNELTLLDLICLVGALGLSAFEPRLLARYANQLRNALSFDQVKAVFASDAKPHVLVKVANIIGFVGGTLSALSMPIKVAAAAAPGGDEGIPVVPSLVVGIGLCVPSVISILPTLIASFVPLSDPKPGEIATLLMNVTLGSLSVLKVLAIDVGLSVVKVGLSCTGPLWSQVGSLVIDFISSHLDCVINLLCLAPITVSIALDRNPSAWMGFTAGLLSAAGGIISPLFWYAQCYIFAGQAVAGICLVTVETGVGVGGVAVGAAIWAGATTALSLITSAQAVCALGCGSLMLGSTYVK